MKVSLPNDAWAVIKPKEEITERTSREVMKLATVSTAVAAKLISQGFVDDKPKTYGPYSALSDQERDDLRAVDDALILALVTSWSFDLPVTKDALLDLPKPLYDALSIECLKEWSKPEVDQLDPKASTGD